MTNIQSATLLLAAVTVVASLSGCSPAVSSACGDAMQSAEYESVQDDAALLATLTACPTAAEWITAIKQHPGAGIYTDYEDGRAESMLDSACIRAITAPACIDASKQGILTFDLDDPRLTELQG